MANYFSLRLKIILWVHVLMLSTAPCLAVDLDVSGAKARYETQRQKANLAKRRYETQQSLFQQSKETLAAAEKTEAQARATLNMDEQKLAGIEREIARIEREISDLQSDLQQYTTRLNGVQTSINDHERAKAELIHQKDHLEHERTRVEVKIKELESKPNPPQSEIDDLKRQLSNLDSELNLTNNEIGDEAWKISNLRSEERELNDQISIDERKVRDNKLALSSTQRDRDRQIRQIDNDREEVRQRANRTLQAESESNQARRSYELAQSEWDQEEKAAGDLYAYYQTVLNNYNNALAEVYSKADFAADSHAFREASERAPENGKAAGLVAAQKIGTEIGNQDARARDYARGYREGREKAVSDPALARPYNEGKINGKDYAVQKARLENFPAGYNDAKRAHFSGLPTQSVVVDMTENLPSDPGGNGVFLHLTDKTPSQKPNPAFEFPIEPPAKPPLFSLLPVEIPSALNLYYNPPCSGLILTEFESLCRTRYDEGYQRQFRNYYHSIFNQNARPVFEANVKTPYQEALAKTNLVAHAEGTVQGAKDQGLLDGFNNALETAQIAEYEQGKKVFRADLAGGAHLVFRSADLEESNGDGVFTPGESLRLKLVIDNYGLQATALEKMRVKVDSSQGVAPLTIPLKGLPALAADSRTQLQGVVKSLITSQVVGEKIALSGALEYQENGLWKELTRIELQTETHYPLELSEVKLPKDPKVDEKTTAQLKFINRLTRDSQPTKAVMATEPQVISFPKPDLEIPKLAAGASVEVPIELIPGVWVGENTLTRFVAQLALGETAVSRQVLSQLVHLDRSAAVLLFDRQGRPIPSGLLTVSAGAFLQVQAQLVYQAKTSLPGPFILRAAKTSEPKIPFGDGSTISINYGSLSPNTTLGKMLVSYQIPQEYKGKKGWVSFQVEEGNKVRHAVMLNLDVK